MADLMDAITQDPEELRRWLKEYPVAGPGILASRMHQMQQAQQKQQQPQQAQASQPQQDPQAQLGALLRALDATVPAYLPDGRTPNPQRVQLFNQIAPQLIQRFSAPQQADPMQRFIAQQQVLGTQRQETEERRAARQQERDVSRSQERLGTEQRGQGFRQFMEQQRQQFAQEQQRRTQEFTQQGVRQPTIPFKDATQLLSAMHANGADEATLKAAANQAGWDVGQIVPGGLFTRDVVVPVPLKSPRQATVAGTPVTPQAPQAAPAAPVRDVMVIRNLRNPDQFAQGPAGPVPEGWARVR